MPGFSCAGAQGLLCAADAPSICSLNTAPCNFTDGFLCERCSLPCLMLKAPANVSFRLARASSPAPTFLRSQGRPFPGASRVSCWLSRQSVVMGLEDSAVYRLTDGLHIAAVSPGQETWRSMEVLLTWLGDPKKSLWKKQQLR